MRKLLVVIIGLLSVQITFAQKYAERFYNITNGLNGAFVFASAQDHENYLWLATDQGLIKFNGKVFQQITPLDSTETDPATAAFAFENNTYFGFQDGKIQRWNGFSLDTLQTEEGGNVIKTIEKDPLGKIWFLTGNQGLLKFDPKTEELKKYPLPEMQGVLSNDFVIDRERMFIANSEGVYIIDISSGEPIFKDVISELEYVPCLSIEEKYTENGFWIGTDDMGLYEIHDEGTDLVTSKTVHLANESIITLEHALNGDLWVGTRLDGLIRINFNRDNPKPVQYSYFNRRNGFPSNEIGSIYTDHRENVWVGLMGDGLAQLYEKAIHYFDFRSDFRITEVNATIQNVQHEIFFATDQGLIMGQYPELSDTLIFSLVRHPLLEGKALTDLEFDLDSNLWIGTKDHGLLIADQHVQSVAKLDVQVPSLEQLTTINDLQADKFGNMWVAARGLGVLELNENREVATVHNLTTGFYHNEIRTMSQDRDGNIWTGAHSAGLAIIKIDDSYDFLSKDKIFPSRDINSLAIDKYGNMWIATQGNGVFEYDGESFVRFTSKDGLLSNFCDAVVEDVNDHIWVSHRKGLTRIDEVTGYISVVQKKDGLIEEDFVYNSAFHDREGNIWLGNRNGVTFLSSPHKTFQHDILETMITDIKLSFEDVDLTDFTSHIDTLDAVIPENLEFPFDQNNLTFEYIAINLRNPLKNVYQFRLEGFAEDQWSPATDLTSASFTNLDPGYYSFQVRQSDNPNYWSDNIYSVEFRIQKPYWKQWWFTSFELLFLGLMSILTYFASTRSTNVFLIRLMIYVSLFIIFEYIHTLLEPYIEAYSGGAPIFQVMTHLLLALVLFPVERSVVGYIRRKQQAKLGREVELEH